MVVRGQYGVRKITDKENRTYIKVDPNAPAFAQATVILTLVAKLRDRVVDSKWVRNELADTGDDEYLAVSKGNEAVDALVAESIRPPASEQGNADYITTTHSKSLA